MRNFDYIIVGSGIAGLLSSLSAAEKGSVLIITKKKLMSGSTPLAQGGIAAVLSKTDNFQKHIEDTLRAGANHNDKKIVEYVVKKAPLAIKKLIQIGVEFDKENSHLSLGLEGGHSNKRIVHVKDMTGRAVEEALIKKIRTNKKITVWENAEAIELIIEKKKCYGIKIAKREKLINLNAKAIILATGGIGQIYEHTTNPEEATGDGISLAAQAGAKLKDMEFVQFHPTAFAKKEDGRHFLLSEALRGEGAVLLNKDKKRFIDELLPRDKVSQAIYEEQKKGPVYLTFLNRDESEIHERFPQIFEYLKKHGYNLAHDLIPITPVAHYLCGGIQVNLKSETSVENLFAVGECACTGLHGANRLASNSLLEAAVFGMEIGQHLPLNNTDFYVNFSKINDLNEPKLEPKSLHVQTSKTTSSLTSKNKKIIQEIMWEHVGIIRTQEGLIIGMNKIKKLQPIDHTSGIQTVSLAICEAALKRKKSLGCHKVVR